MPIGHRSFKSNLVFVVQLALTEKVSNEDARCGLRIGVHSGISFLGLLRFRFRSENWDDVGRTQTRDDRVESEGLRGGSVRGRKRTHTEEGLRTRVRRRRREPRVAHKS